MEEVEEEEEEGITGGGDRRHLKSVYLPPDSDGMSAPPDPMLCCF